MVNQDNTLLLLRSHLNDTDHVKCFFPHDFMSEEKKNNSNSFKLRLILCQYHRIFQINFVSILKLIYTLYFTIYYTNFQTLMNHGYCFQYCIFKWSLTS